MNKDIKPRQISFFFIAFLPLVKFFTLPKSASQIANEDMWISVFICIILDLVAIVFLLNANRKFGVDFYTILEGNFGTAIAKTVYLIYLVYFLFKAFTPVFEQYNFLQVTLYEPAPSSFKYFPFLILAIYLCTLKLRAIGRLSDILWLITILSIVTLVSLAVNDIDIGAILPIGANKGNIFKASYYILNWFTDASYLLFMIGRFKCEKLYKTKILSGFITYAVMTVAFCIIFYCVFTHVAGRELFAIAEVSKYSNVLNSIGRFDYMAIFALLIPHTVAIILPLNFASRILKRVFPSVNKIIWAVICPLIVYAPVVWFNPYATAIAEFIHTFFTPVAFVLGNLLPCLIILLRPPKENTNAVCTR